MEPLRETSRHLCTDKHVFSGGGTQEPCKLMDSPDRMHQQPSACQRKPIKASFFKFFFYIISVRLFFKSIDLLCTAKRFLTSGWITDHFLVPRSLTKSRRLIRFPVGPLVTTTCCASAVPNKPACHHRSKRGRGWKPLHLHDKAEWGMRSGRDT